MNDFKKFQSDLKIYSKYEDVLALKLIKKYLLEPIYVKCTNKDFDIKLSNDVTYELKCNPGAIRSNFVFVEFTSRGVESGIYSTKADFYVFCFDLKNFYSIPTNDLILMCMYNNYKIMTTRDKLTFGYLMPMDEFLSNSELV